MCKKKFFNLNKNIKISYLGHKKKKYINKIMKRSHCLFLPSKFESFGHVIFESFLNGLPVITSKHTPWKNLKIKKIGADLAFSEKGKFISEIKALKLCSTKKYRSIRMNALSYSKKIINQNKIYKRKDLF